MTKIELIKLLENYSDNQKINFYYRGNLDRRLHVLSDNILDLVCVKKDNVSNEVDIILE